jgi:hypothetical protein
MRQPDPNPVELEDGGQDQPRNREPLFDQCAEQLAAAYRLLLSIAARQQPAEPEQEAA